MVFIIVIIFLPIFYESNRKVFQKHHAHCQSKRTTQWSLKKNTGNRQVISIIGKYEI